MPDGFSTPAGKKFPEPVPVEMVDEARREEYADITPDIEEPKVPEAAPAAAPVDQVLEEKIEAISDEVISFVNDGFRMHFRKGLLVLVEPIPKEDLAQPTDDDKKEFVRSIFGSTAYTKKYVLFGGCEALFKDRGVAETEGMYEDINKLHKSGEINLDNEAEATLWIRRYQMAETLVYVKLPDGTAVYSRGENSDRKQRVKKLLELARPLYQAAYDTAIDFERHIELLTQKARDPGFWRAGGTS
jgi:hypothetical protein